MTATAKFGRLFDLLSQRDPTLNATLYEDREFAALVTDVYAALFDHDRSMTTPPVPPARQPGGTTTAIDPAVLTEIADRLEAEADEWYRNDRLYEQAGQLAESDRCALRSMQARREAETLRAAAAWLAAQETR